MQAYVKYTFVVTHYVPGTLLNGKNTEMNKLISYVPLKFVK